MKLTFDIETDGLDYTKIWLVVARDLSTGDEYVFSDYDPMYPDLDGFKDLFDKAEVLIGHNIIGFDIPAIEKVTGWVPNGHKLIDTLLISQLNDFYRPGLEKFRNKKGVHAMDTWGRGLGDEKHDDPSWLEYSVAMRERCRSDVVINEKIYRFLMQEIKRIKTGSESYPQAIKREHDFASAMAEQEVNGWLFDDKAANKLLRHITRRMAEIEIEIEPKLKDRVSYIDKEPREPLILKDGRYDRITRDWFGVDMPTAGTKIPSSYQRTKTVTTDLGSNDAVIDLLLEEGWEPDEWNWKVTLVNGRKNFEKRGPKLTDTSMDTIKGDLGKTVAEWRMLRSRKGFVENQLKAQREDKRISCSAFTIGTNTFRVRHRGIVNVPGSYAPLGKEIRQLYIAREGYSIVSADSSGNQLRGFCHYLNNSEVSDAVAFGKQEDGTDIHTRNANLVGVPRNIVKNLTYALLFGAGDKKLAKTGGFKESEGKLVREKMIVAYPGFDKLVRRVEDQWTANYYDTGRGFVWGLDGRPVYCEKYKALNALLQTFEAVTMKEALNDTMKVIQDNLIDATLLIHYHDEYSFEVRDGQTELVEKILAHSLGDHLTKTFNLNIPMQGDPATGANWYEVH